MTLRRITAALLLTGLVAAGCNGNDTGRNLPPAQPSSVPASTPNSSSGPGTAPQDDRDKRRGNTPPGMDRSGGGPADGAIRDPGGAVIPPTR